MAEIAGIHYRFHKGGETTQQTAVILIHGAGLDSRFWPISLKRLPGCWTYIIDLPGHGSSQGVCRHSIKGYVYAIRDFLTALGLYNVILIGHGLGGAIGLALVSEAPDLVRGLYLINPLEKFSLSEESLMLVSRGKILDAFLALLSWGLPQTAGDHVRACLTGIINAQRVSVLKADFRVLQTYQQGKIVLPESMPIEVLLGRENRLLGWDHHRFFLYSTTKTWVREAGHWLPMEKPQVVQQHIKRFISRTNLLNP